MKMMLLALLVLAFAILGAQDITGTWNGMLDAGGQKFRLVFHIEKSDEGFAATMDSPDQGAFGLPASRVSFSDGWVEIVLDAPPLSYSGKLEDEALQGSFRQGPMEIPLMLKREELAAPVYERPQEPKAPFPYRVEEVIFPNREAGFELAGTLTLPEGEGPFPAVVLVSGSGPQNRDEEILGHKPFLVIADHLTRKGIAVLRYDDRGVGGSGGVHDEANTFDFALDAQSAVKYLKTRQDIGKIGMIGHSEGGIIAPIVAAQNKDLGFIVLLAGTGVRGDKLLLMQQEHIFKASGMDKDELAQTLKVNAEAFELVIQASELESFEEDFAVFLKERMDDGSITIPAGMTYDQLFKQQMDTICSPWMFDFIRLDPAEWLERTKCPVLALNGTKDLQVPYEPNLSAIEAALKKGGNKDITLQELPGLNHLFQECESGLPAEYVNITQTFSPLALELISDWIWETVKGK